MLCQKHFSNSKRILIKVSFYFSECPIGYIGLRCSQRCPTPKYGRLCLSTCSCPAEQCNAITGCNEGKFVQSSFKGMAVCITRTGNSFWRSSALLCISYALNDRGVFIHNICFMMSSVLC